MTNEEQWHVGKRLDALKILGLSGAFAGAVLTVFFWAASIQQRIAILENQDARLMDRIDRVEKTFRREIMRIERRFDNVDAALIRIQRTLSKKGRSRGRPDFGEASEYPLFTELEGKGNDKEDR